MKDACCRKHGTKLSGANNVSRATKEIKLTHFSYECTHLIPIYSYY